MRISLHFKLLLIALLMLPIPLIGFRFGAMLKSSLLTSHRDTLMLTARSVAATLNNRPELFERELFQSLDQSRDLYLFELSRPIHLNGEVNDWLPELRQAKTFGSKDILSSSLPFGQQTISFEHLVGQRGDFLYALFMVKDDRIVYRKSNSLYLDRSDHLQIGVVDNEGRFCRYIVATDKPGWVNGYLLVKGDEMYFPAKNEPRIQGMWKKTGDGYNLEIRIPLSFISRKLAFAVADVDDPLTGDTLTLIGTATTETIEELGCLLSRSKPIESILQSLNRPQARIWVVDAGSRVRGRFGSLHPENEVPPAEQNRGQQLITLLHRPLRPLYNYFMEPYAKDFIDHKTQRARLDIEGIEEGLKGQGSIFTYHLPDQQVEVMAAITPLINEGQIIGAVVVEQTTNSILALKNRVIEESIDFTVLAFSIGGLCLLLFASRLSSRIRRLRDQAARAITSDGRIVDTITVSRSSDEVGDLGRTLATMLAHLKQQSEYREKMADNLEHEMRTPLAAVSASLKNLADETGVSEKGREYAQWAMQDVRRLEALLTAIRDATTLKDALIHDFPESFDLGEATEMWLTHSWQLVFPENIILLERPAEPLPLLADPGRIRQMLDKLVENGVDFSSLGSPLKIFLQKRRGEVEIQVMNHGKELTPEMQGQIFNSMISIRSQSDAKPHLGLGLFIVRTIVEHYKGTVTASSLPEPELGALFTITLPLAE